MQRKPGKNNVRKGSGAYKKREDSGREDFRKDKKENDRGSRPFNKERKPDSGRGRDKRDDRFSKETKRPSRDASPGRSSDRKPFVRKETGRDSRPFDRERKPDWNKDRNKSERKDERFESDRENSSRDSSPKKFSRNGSYNRKPYIKKSYKKTAEQAPTIESTSGLIRLNRYLANAGVCSRREADELIGSGVVTVNGKVVTEMGFKVNPTDIVTYAGETLKREKLVYLLLNKPKDYITTVDDPQKRKTVFELIRNACRERIYPVGRLDRSTTGVLLFTNDGDLTKRLTHPRYGIKKMYHVTLDKNLSKEHFDQVASGIELEDGPIKVDEISYVSDGTKKEIGIEIHSGRNRIVRRIFESLGYAIVKLDRVYFGGLTKKDLPKGRWKFLSEQEINMLKMTAK